MSTKNLVLSGGGARGFAHLGVIKALAEHGITPCAISGTSAGALAGVFIANGFTPEEIADMFTTKLEPHLFAWNGFKMGIVSNRHIRQFMVDNLRYQRFEDLRIQMFVTATNFGDGRQRVFDSGDVIDVILASCSIPVVFPPVMIDHIPYVDGGLSNNLPIEPFNSNRKEVITVYVNPIKPFSDKETFSELIDRAIHLSFREMMGRSSAGCYMHIEPPGLSRYGLFDIHKLNEIFAIGYNYTNDLLTQKNL